MRFLWPQLLWLLLALPVLALAGSWSAARRRGALIRFAGGAAHAERFLAGVSANRRAVKTLLLYVALIGLIVAAARPQWGTRLEEVTRQGIDVAFVIDTSLSMAAEDVPPSRLELARNQARTLLGRVAGDRVALITFAGRPTMSTPLTLDHGAVRLFLDALRPETVQVPGTALAEALTLAADALARTATDAARGGAVVLFSDGEDHEGELDGAIELLRERGVAVFALGTGTARGAPIPVDDASGYKRDRDGRVVTTRLDEDLLERLALETGGRYYRATAAEVEIVLVADALAGLDASEFGAVLRARYEERFQVPLAIALLALLVETLLGDRRRAPGAAAGGSGRRAA